MVSQRSLLSATRLLTILLASFSVISSANGAAQNEEDSAETINGITISEADQAPDCMYECPALEKYGSGSGLPQCVTEQLTDSPYADMIKSGDYGSDEETLQNINEIMSCICTDVGFVKELADCVFNEPCGNNNTAIYEAISIGYKVCGVMYNVTYPAPTEVVKMLQISVPSGVIVPTTITGVPQATAWPGKTVSSATISSSNPSSATATSSSSNSSDTVIENTNAAMKSSPSYYLVFLAFFAFLAVSVSAQSNGTNPISSTTTGIPSTTTAIANGTLISTSTVAITSASNGTLTSTSTATNNITTSTTSSRTSSVGTSSTTRSSASASSTDAPDDAIRNGASFGLVAAGAVAAAFLF